MNLIELTLSLWIFGMTCTPQNALEYDKSERGLTEVPSDIPNDVREINIRKNSISYVESLPYYPDLEKIDLDFNMLTEFPDFCLVNQTLVNLQLGMNQIANISKDLLECFQKLEKLDLAKNKLITFPTVFLPSLTSLQVYTNKLIDLPPLEKVSPNILDLGVSKNPFLFDNAEILERVSIFAHNLTVLGLWGLDFTHLDVEIMSKFLKLDELRLGQNLFKNMPYLGENIEKSLTMLSLDNNPISHLNIDQIRRFQKLEKLKLENCLITRLEQSCHIKPGLVIHLKGNPIICDCHSKEMKMAADAGVVILENTKCAQPTELATYKLKDVPMEQLSCNKQGIMNCMHINLFIFAIV